jgi:chromosome segregation ATPase
LDFTQQFEAISTFSQRINSISRRSPSKSQSGESQLLSYIQNQRSPRKPNPTSTPLKNNQNILNLLDFELPPAPTPRSIPTITIRELESLKSSFASQISSLKATLSGREAEVEALKRAVTDAERRVGESAETAREETARRECVERDREEWERRGRDFEAVLRKVRAQVLEAETERGELVRRADEADERCREAEARVADAEARAARAESSRLERLDVGGAAGAGVANGSAESGEKGPLFTAEQVQKQIDEKVHALSTELHAIYKKKHITKVAGLKKGFEAKTKEKTSELQARVDALERQTEELQAKLDGTFSGVLPTTLAAASLSGVSTAQRDAELKKLEEQAAVIERQKAELAGRDEELRTRRSEYDVVMRELERERVEKGELVAAVDEMLALQSDTSVLGASMSEHHQQQLQLQLQNGGGASSAGTSIAEDLLRKSVGLSARPSGLARPGFGFAGQSKIAAPSSGLAKPLAGKSRMMSNIERMGGGRSMD